VYNLTAAVIVGKKEGWRRKAIWNRVQEFRALTGIPITSPIISLIVGSEEKALKASRFPLSLSLSLSQNEFSLAHAQTLCGCCNSY
jgi:7-keto-8-aminopelargonate synthetase-like enzyme